MRRGVLLFLITILILLGLAVNQVWTLITLLFVDGSEDAISKSELPAPGSSQVHDRPQLIPKILHQTWQNESIPAVWKGAQQSCLDIHRQEDGWEYMLWTDDKMDAFMRKEYPWFVETFDGYPYPIQRADAIRYFALKHYGGVYLDLDDGCNRDMEPLLSYPAWVRKTIPTGISNDAMGATPDHPFFKRVIDDLQSYDRSWILPYITVMGSTGPLFLSVIWRHYSSEGLNEGDGKIRILYPDEYQGKAWSFFTHHLGNSWHGNDVQLIFWVCSSLSFPLAHLTNSIVRWPETGSSSPSSASL
jgi:inositol phosphorylceramide mannosyltransferase catalytic subunit